MPLCDLCFHGLSLPCLHTFWHAIPAPFYIFDVFYFLELYYMNHAITFANKLIIKSVGVSAVETITKWKQSQNDYNYKKKHKPLPKFLSQTLITTTTASKNVSQFLPLYYNSSFCIVLCSLGLHLWKVRNEST